MPSVIAAIAGGNTAAATADNPWSVAIATLPSTRGTRSDVAVTSTAPLTTTARLAVAQSTRAPAGAWATIPITPATDMTVPIEAASQW